VAPTGRDVRWQDAAVSVHEIEIQGQKLPVIGFGTGGLAGATAVESVRDALELGYRHIDTARMYRNEAEVGEGIRRSGLPREDVFVTTKLFGPDLAGKAVGPATDESLQQLAVGQIDLLLIHGPSADVPLAITLDAMVKQQEAGKVRHIGVSNFPLALLREAQGHALIFTNQVPYQVGRHQAGLTEVARTEDFLLTAYSPIKGDAVRGAVVAEIADAHAKTPQQVALRWLVQQPHVVPIPRSADSSRRRYNFDIFDFELSDEEMARLGALSNSPGE
jgi:2,5-diketo-D-gluconate reductase B